MGCFTIGYERILTAYTPKIVVNIIHFEDYKPLLFRRNNLVKTRQEFDKQTLLSTFRIYILLLVSLHKCINFPKNCRGPVSWILRNWQKNLILCFVSRMFQASIVVLVNHVTLVDKIILCADAVLWNLSTKKLGPPKFAVHVYIGDLESFSRGGWYIAFPGWN